jgi:hypothetical protein
VIFMVSKLMLLYLIYICLSNFPVLILELFFDIQGPWKKKNLADFGIVNQCMCPLRVNDNYLGNIMLKINAKVYSYGSALMVTSCEATFYM